MDISQLPASLQPFTTREKEVVAAIAKAAVWNIDGDLGLEPEEVIDQARTIRLMDEYSRTIMHLADMGDVIYARSIAKWQLTGQTE